MRHLALQKIVPFCIVLLVAANSAMGQSAYYDALAISQAVNRQAKYDLLKKYALDNEGRPCTDTFCEQLDFKGNPFFSATGLEWPHQPNTGEAVSAGAALPPGVGSANVTAIADGLGKFLAKRTKEELDIAFFQQFDKFLKCHPEIGVLFPSTILFLDDIYQYQTSNMLSMLRAAFESDLKALPGNIASVANLDAGSCNCAPDKQKEKCKERIAAITAFFNTGYGRAMVAALGIADGIVNKKNPAEIFSSIAGNASLAHLPATKTTNDVLATLQLINIFSQSLRSGDPARVWVTPEELRSMNAGQAGIFACLVYQQAARENITIDGQPVVAYMDDAASIINYAGDFNDALQNVETGYQWLRSDKRADTDNVVHDSAFIASLQGALRVGEQFEDLGITQPASPRLQMIYTCADTALAVANMIVHKNYYGAVLTTTFMIDKLLQTGSDFDSKGNVTSATQEQFARAVKQALADTATGKAKVKQFISSSGFSIRADSIIINGYELQLPPDLAALLNGLPYDNAVQVLINYVYDYTTLALNKKDFLNNLARYGNFMADMVSAQNSDDAEAAIEAIALPPGSASIKRHTDFNICAQAYAGLAYAHLSDGHQVAAYAPVGVAFSLGLKDWQNGFSRHTWGSASLFLQLVDIGAIVAYRFKDPNTSLNDTVKITFENIFAPGANLVYGIPGVPISVGGGFEWQAQLQKLAADNKTVINTPGTRWHVFAAIDLPLINMHTSRR